jgi:transposase
MGASKDEQASSFLEWRRLRAWELKQAGWEQKLIAEALGVTEGAVSQWIKRGRERGVDALHAQPRRGARSRLTAEQRAQLPELLLRGAEAFGFEGDVWTLPRIADVIEREFGVHYHPSHVSRILHDCGWSPQKPMLRATQRDEDAIAEWRDKRWPELKKTPKNKGKRRCSSMNPASASCPPWFAPGRP